MSIRLHIFPVVRYRNKELEAPERVVGEHGEALIVACCDWLFDGLSVPRDLRLGFARRRAVQRQRLTLFRQHVL